ncbi:MAG: regulatory iron-sulfur-containing complex subunit RicT, partial [Desulfosarcina sp.]
FVLNLGDQVIVETEKGLGYGTVETAPEQIEETSPSGKPLKKVFRKANEKDLGQVEHNRSLEREAHAFCQKSIRTLGLKMNLFSVEGTFDANRLTFFFTADGRVDFRQLVKILVKQFKVRIEMRQVGIRNQAKMCGGMGRCGRVFCCASFMDKFEPVSIRMAKQQGLSLNPTKISGQCGRLMCCLTFENQTYRLLKQDFPKIGKIVATKNGPGKVTRHNVICNRLTVRLEEGGEVEISLDDIVNERN